REMEAVPITLEGEALLTQMSESAHSRLPVYEGDLDSIVGVLHLKDVVRQSLKGGPLSAAELLRRAPLVPESTYIETLLNSMRRGRQHLAIVIDEYGGTAGIVTLEDLVEEVVGEVRDEFDEAEEAPFTVVEPGRIEIQGTYPLESANERFDLGDFSEYDADTVGGLVLAHLNRPPQRADEVTIEGVRYVVDAVDGLAITHLSIYLPSNG
ncbi:MAG: CBS domain-containing protein, partial [Anaerolineae bacterium]|nr:CBS domain-containing protein [Anaerolineae bacterium]